MSDLHEPNFLKDPAELDDPFAVPPTPASGMPAVRTISDTTPAPAPEPHSLTFEDLRSKNLERLVAAYPEHQHWGPELWALCAAGEIGEACNAIKKKFLRGEASSVLEIGYEVADVVIYLDLLAHSLGFKLEDLVAEKFNIVSERKNVEIYL